MSKIDSVLATVNYSPEQRAELTKSFAPAPVTFVSANDRATLLHVISDVTVAVLGGNAFPEILEQPRLKWIHCDHAGIDGFAPARLLDGHLIVTSSAGRSAPALAEHALMFMLALNFRLSVFQTAKRCRLWGVEGQHELRALRNKTVLIVGTGHTGSEVARLCSAIGMQVIGYRRSLAPLPKYFDSMSCATAGDSLLKLIPQADVVVLAASLNNASHHLIASEQLTAMKPSAILINVGRGGLVDEPALAEALHRRKIAGAGIDVTSPEPPRFCSPLWRCPNLLLTPHFTPRLDDRTERSIALIAENVLRYKSDQPLLNQLGPEDVYTLNPTRTAGRLETKLTKIWRRTVRRSLSLSIRGLG